MKMINECNYTEVINASDAEKDVNYGILSSGEDQNTTLVNLVKNSSDGEHNDTDSISKCNSSNEKSSPNNTTSVLAEKDETTFVNVLNESEIADDCVKSNDCIKTHKSLDDALIDCINETRLDDSDDDFTCDQLIEDLKENCSTSQIQSSLHNNKRKLLLSNTCEGNSSYDIEGVYTNYNKTKKARTTIEISDSDDYPRQKSKSSQENTVDVPNIVTNQSFAVEESTKKERFLQKDNCLRLPSNIEKCIECRRHHQMKKKLTQRDYDNISCRFYAFRLLKFSKSGKLCVAGFPDPYKNPNNSDISKWLPDKYSYPHSDFNVQASIKILKDTGGQFCQLVQDEKDALRLHNPTNDRKKKILWKKCVNGIREMCDVCKTSIFNYHWSCGKCGFVVCIDCFRTKLNGSRLPPIHSLTNKYNQKTWLRCSNQEEHNVHKLLITQMLTGDVLNQTWKLMHSTCILHEININCNCLPKSTNYTPPSVSIDIVTNTFLDDDYAENISFKNDPSDLSKLFALVSKQDLQSLTSVTEQKTYLDRDYSTIPLTVPNKNIEDKSHSAIIDMRTKREFAPKLSLMYDNKTNAPYMWLCEGRLLRLLDPTSNDNFELFQEQWKRGQPVLVSNVGNCLKSSLWHPESFSRDFGDQNNDIIDCTTGKVLDDHPMCKFWDGFDNVAVRLCDKQGSPMLLKLKDWPPSADFAEILPDRFLDLMNCLPLKEYTHRNGRFNLASRLPECFVRPDLGPKMYTAYGNAGVQHEKIGTTNLHLDMSDAINVMVYVAITKNCPINDYDWYVKQALEVIEEAGCDDLTMKRIHTHGEIPGALWHIYDASDAAAIRDLLIKVDVEHGTLLEEFSDPIHDQSHYLDDYLRERLFREYGVKGYAIVQFCGDAVFIPAGAPHQVRNLHNCIKVAEDFVSPENVHHSFCMTQEFRNLTDSHTNHEDKLQIKNIVYHAVKDSISVLLNNK